jgi:hypothetical protein
MVKNSGELIQAFPIHGNTQVFASVTDFETRDYNIIHCNADTTLTFRFGNSNTVTVDAVAGSDYAIGDGCTSLDSTGSIIIS